MPGVSLETRMTDCCLYLSALLGSVLPKTMKTLQRGSPIPEDHHFCVKCQRDFAKSCFVATYLTVQNVMITITLDGHLNICSITGSDLRLRHQKRRSNLAVQERIKPLPLLCLTAILGDHFHVTSIRSSTVGSLSRVNISSISCLMPIDILPQRLSGSCPSTRP